jgi:hypothetical protein
VQTSVLWTRLSFGEERWLVYSPRFARTYLVAPDLAASSGLRRLLGLGNAAHVDELVDPAGYVAQTRAIGPDTEVGRILPRLYLFFHKHRALGSVGRGLRVASWFARLPRNRRRWGAPEIGRQVMAVEDAAGTSDCYPRALLTAYLCMTAGLSCEVTIGVLAPTTNMHAWCSTGGVIPYEPEPEHWFYSPLVVFCVAS